MNYSLATSSLTLFDSISSNKTKESRQVRRMIPINSL